MKKILIAITACMLTMAFEVSAQDETIRITTELVQTDVMVFDKQGRFVDGLKPEQFQLLVDGKAQAISFFERVVAGSGKELVAQRAARGGPTTGTANASVRSLPGRTIIFFLDDFHLSTASVNQVRNAILQFVEKEMRDNDQILIRTATGQIGFLEQLTDNKAVLRAAVARFNHRPYSVRDSENIPMTEYQAIKISQGDRDAIGYYVTQLQQATNYSSPGGQLGPPAGGPGAVGQRVQQGNTGTASPAAYRYEAQVKRRAESLLNQSVAVTANTLNSLENVMRLSSQRAGRKLIFFVSDGFFLIDRKSGATSRLQQITDAAAQSGVVIYSLDARGMTNFTDASSNRSDPIGQLSRSNVGELSASQDALAALADDTGGRALFNNDAFNSAVTNALKETSNYYMLAWKPASEEQHGGKFKRVEVSIAGMPNVNIRLPRGYVDGKAVAEQTRVDEKLKKQETPTKPEAGKSQAEIDIRTALLAFGPRNGVGTSLSTSFIDTPNNGPVLMTSTQVEAAGLGYGDDGKGPAAVDIVGVVLNDQGKQAANFKTRLNVKAPASGTSVPANDGFVYEYRAPLSPGLYQVRVAARDDKTGRVGSAMQWIELPDLKSKRLTLSSVLLGGMVAGVAGKDGGSEAGQQVQFSVDRRFKRTMRMSILSFVYNASRNGPAMPELLGQIHVYQDGKAILTSPQRKIAVEGLDDMARIPYASELSLSTLPAGSYTLQITISDRGANSTATQRIRFEVE